MTAVKELQLAVIGEVPVGLLRELEAPIEQVLGVGAWVGKGLLPEVAFAFNKERRQYHTTAVTRRLLTVREPSARFVMGVADVDLFVPDTPFVYGEADREARAAVMSIWRLRGEGDAWKRRACVEAVHQVGHLLGLSYCEDARCAMFQATTITDAERRQLHLCNNCRNEFVKQRKM